MSEYMEKHAVSKLIGAPPGYVGFDEVWGKCKGGWVCVCGGRVPLPTPMLSPSHHEFRACVRGGGARDDLLLPSGIPFSPHGLLPPSGIPFSPYAPPLSTHLHPLTSLPPLLRTAVMHRAGS